jgi:hypothetical protein
VDIIADKEGISWGIQNERYSGLVKIDAVRQVVAGLSMILYGFGGHFWRLELRIFDLILVFVIGIGID